MKNFFPGRAVSCRVLFCCGSFNLMVKPYNKSFIDQACSVKMAGYWPRSFFAFLWTETKSRSIKTQKKNLAMKIEKQIALDNNTLNTVIANLENLSIWHST